MDIKIKKNLLIVIISIIFSLLLSIDALGQAIRASDIYLTPGGETIGIELQTQVMVVDTYVVNSNNGKINPAKEAGIQTGDIILSIDGEKINTIEDLKLHLIHYKNAQNKPMSMIIKRNNKIINKEIYPAITNNNMISLGVYLRDNITGIGTLTFIYNDFYFGALGHKIQDKNVSSIDNLSTNGVIKRAEVTSYSKSTKGSPGAKKARFSENIGKISNNTITGVYGKIDNNRLIGKEKLRIATQDEVQLGDAKILTVLEKDKVEAFDVKIIELHKQNKKDVKGIKIKVTDERLINKTGGIIQGMSGSPIIQNNRIVGAITHVLVDDATIGYGVYIEFMLEDMGIDIIR